jgi:uncharacterized membrane protein YgdD (TMEM256/DUF423 family)
MEKSLTALAALLGLCGIILAAMAGHMKALPNLRTASNICLFHAPALIAILAARRTGLFHPTLSLVASAILAGGVILFCGDLVFRSFQGYALVPMLAPIGGAMMMIGWALTMFSVFGTTKS